MPFSEIVLTAIVDSVIGYAFDQGGIGDRLRDVLKRDPIKTAYKNALRSTFEDFEKQHPDWTANLFDESFLQHEGASVLAKLLQRDRHATPSELAEKWADSLRIKEPDRRTAYMRELEPVAADFLVLLSAALKDGVELADLHDSRAIEQLATDVSALRTLLGAGRATAGTRRDYLQWLIERNLYVDPRGTMQTERQVQLRLDEVYVSLQADRDETPGIADKRVLNEKLSELEAQLASEVMTIAEIEDARESLIVRLTGHSTKETPNREAVELAVIVGEHDKLVILGDPGSGKTTLVRFLALKHAMALQRGTEDDSGIGPVYFPILIRIADYAESEAYQTQGLSDFLNEYYRRLECPQAGLVDLLETELKNGKCLILLDGLDEIVSSDIRRKIVKQIEEFVRRHDDAQNRFVVTSRIAGYRSAALLPPFVHYTVRDMNDEQVQRFLEKWCLAVETAQTPDVSIEIRKLSAKREVDGITSAIERSPGVRRLAVNPLLLRTLALIHRTGAQLPQKRIELYKLAADTLARTWRTAQGVAESALVRDEFLTPMLGALAYWMHEHKPTGIATEQEVYVQLGKEWARVRHIKDWDPDEPDPEIVTEIQLFLQAVREHTGLFVERAPQRYGFMHLTFEEYYAARHLVRNSRKRSKLIRHHLHDPRWEEPILLALGFVGMDFPQDAAELLETSVLAQGETAEELELQPSKYENLLERDFLFALRCLGDEVPCDPVVMKSLLERLVDDFVQEAGVGQFKRGQELLSARLENMIGSKASHVMIELLQKASTNVDITFRSRAINMLGFFVAATTIPYVLNTLIAALHDSEPKVRMSAVQALSQVANLTSETSGSEARQALIGALCDSEPEVRMSAVQALSQVASLTSEVNGSEARQALIGALRDSEPEVRVSAAQWLGQVVFFQMLRASQPEVNVSVGQVLDQVASVNFEVIGSEVCQSLIGALRDSEPEVRMSAARWLGQVVNLMPEVTGSEVRQVLIEALRDSEPQVRVSATLALGQVARGNSEVVSLEARQALIEAFRDSESEVRISVAQVLGQVARGNSKAIDSEVLQALIEALRDSEPEVRTNTALMLIQANAEIRDSVDILVDYFHLLSGYSRRRDAVLLIGEHSVADVRTTESLKRGMLDEDDDVRLPHMRGQIEQLFLGTIGDSEFEPVDKYQKRSGQDYAFTGLWNLMESRGTS